MKALGGFLFGLLAGALMVLLANRTPQGREVVARTDQSLQGFIDGVVEGFREPGRQ